MFKRLAVLVTLVLALFAGSASLSSAKAPSPIVGTEDVCACGGQVYFVLKSRSYANGTTTCNYDVYYSNGQQAPWNLYRSWSGNVACPPNG